MSQPTTRRQLFKTAGATLAGGVAFSSIATAAQADLPASSRDLKITGVKTYKLLHKLKTPFGVSVSVPLSTTRTALVVKIETDAGLVGWGETAPVGGARGTIDSQLAPLLIGQNPLAYRTLWRSLWGANFGNGLAVGAVEMAINDLRGKTLGLPVADLFGGRYRDEVPVYASTMNYMQGEEPETLYPRQAAETVKQGFKALKMRIGRYSVAREEKFIRAVRDAVGPEIRLMADGNAAYTLRTAVQMGRVLDELNFDFFEEPLPQSPRYAGYPELREKLPLPLAGGEGVDSRIAAKGLLDRRAGCDSLHSPLLGRSDLHRRLGPTALDVARAALGFPDRFAATRNRFFGKPVADRNRHRAVQSSRGKDYRAATTGSGNRSERGRDREVRSLIAVHFSIVQPTISPDSSF